MFRLLFSAALWRWLQNAGKDVAEPPIEEDPIPESVEPPEPVAPVVPKEIVYPRVQRAAMGSLFEVYLAGTDRDTLVGAGEEALDEVERLERQLSHYRDDSDIARLNRHAAAQWVRLEPRLYHLLKRCYDLGMETE